MSARGELAAVLGDGATVGEADEDGALRGRGRSRGLEAALQRAWDAVAASGTDDHLVFLEHPDVPEHWRNATRSPGWIRPAGGSAAAWELHL